MAAKTDFPWAAPTAPRPAMSRLEPEDCGRFADVLEWFLEHRGAKTPSSGSPIKRWVGSLRRVASGEPMLFVPHAATLAPATDGSADIGAAACDLYAACATAHAIQIVKGFHAAGVITVEVDASFITKELGASDASARDVPSMPASMGTMLLAADFARLREGTLRIFGNGSEGLDVEWIGTARQTIRVEAKGRAFATAFGSATTRENLLRWAGSQVRDASAALRSRCSADDVDALRVVRLTGFLPVGRARDVHSYRMLNQIRRELSRMNPDDLPHAVIAHWFGIDIEVVDGALFSVADSLPHIIDVPFAEPAAASAISAFYRMAGVPIIYNPQLRSREALQKTPGR